MVEYIGFWCMIVCLAIFNVYSISEDNALNRRIVLSIAFTLGVTEIVLYFMLRW